MRTLFLLVFTFLLFGAAACFPSKTPPGPPATSMKNTANDNVTVRLLDSAGQLSAPTAVPRVVKTEAEWRALLTPAQYAIIRAKGTERPFCGVFHDNKQDGHYTCAGCRLPLFASSAKFDSGTGWPSFLAPLAQENITCLPDTSHGMLRTEILCTRCEAHLGHVFSDGPPPDGLRFCLNSESLLFSATAPGRE